MPLWLTIELAVFPFVLIGLIWIIRLEMIVRRNQEEIAEVKTKHDEEIAKIKKDFGKEIAEVKQDFGKEIAELRENQGEHNKNLYSELKDISKTVHKIEGYLRIPEKK